MSRSAAVSRSWVRLTVIPGVAIATLIGLMAVPADSPSAGKSAADRCDGFASPRGSERSANGSLNRPYHSPQKLVSSLRRGETGCFRKGAYEFGTLNIEKRNVTLTPFKSERVTLRGEVKVLPGGEETTIRGLNLNADGIGPRIYADHVVLRKNDITNHHEHTCIHVNGYFDGPAPVGVVIEGNRIHECGRVPSTNHDHGIYLAETRGAKIRNNRIYDNADRGIQLYPDAQGTTITGNVIRRNGDGIVFSGDGGSVSNDNLVQGNVIADSRLGWNVYSGDQGPQATGNRLRGNCVHATHPEPKFSAHGGIQTPSRNFNAFDNVVKKPENCRL